MSSKVAIVVLNWNGWQDTLECVASLKHTSYPEYDIVVVDNGSTDQSVERILKAFPKITLLRNPINLGSAEGCNVGIRYSLEKGADYVFLLNNDTIVGKETIRHLVRAEEKNNGIGMLGPQIYSYSNPLQIESSGGKLNLVTGRIYHNNYGKQLKKIDKNLVRVADFLSGCALLVKRGVIERIGYLDSHFFCYMEDVDWCIRARMAGFQVAVIPAASVWHKGARSTGGYSSPLRIYYVVRNHLHLVSKHHPLKHPFLRTLRHIHVLMLSLGYIFITSEISPKNGCQYLFRALKDFNRNRLGGIPYQDEP